MAVTTSPPGSGRQPQPGPTDHTPAAWQRYRAEQFAIREDAVCPACGGLGWLRADVPRGDPAFGTLVRCETCTEDARRVWIARNCGLEGTMLDYRLRDWRAGAWLDHLRQERVAQRIRAQDAMQEAIDRRAGHYTFFGDFGAGKTMALAIVANELRDRMVEVFYAPMAAILDHLRSLYGRGEETSAFWERLLDVPVLCLDEVTRIQATEWALDRLFVLADTRYRRRATHLTVWATNDDPRVSPPPTETAGYLWSRLREGQLVELRGDMRQAAGRNAAGPPKEQSRLERNGIPF